MKEHSLKSTLILGPIIILLFLAPFLYQWMQNPTYQEIHLNISNSPSNLDPAKNFDDQSLEIMAQMYEPLYQYHYLIRPYKIVPLLAEELPIFTDGLKKIQIKIKKGIFYHPHPALTGVKREVKAIDFINQIKRMVFVPLKSPGSWLFADKIKGIGSYIKKVNGDFSLMFKENISGLYALDDYTLVMELDSPCPQMIYLLAMNFVVPLPQEVLEKESNNLDRIDIGTGPFYLKEFNENNLILEKFSEYRQDFYPNIGDRYANDKNLLHSGLQPIPFLNRINYSFYNDDKKAWQSFLERKLDIIDIPNIYRSLFSFRNEEELPPEVKKQGAQLKYFSGLTVRWLSFNMKDPIWGKNLYLRKAVAHAIDFEGYLNTITQNTYLQANSILAPGIPGYNPDHQPSYGYGPELARKYLIQAGYPEGRGLPPLTYTTRSRSSMSLQEAQFIKEQLGKIGIQVNIDEVEFEVFLRKGRNGELQFFTDNWIFDYPDPENILQLLVSKNHPGINKSGYTNAKVDNYYRQILSSSSEEDKLDLTKKIEDIVYEELPWIMLTYERSYILLQKRVENFRRSSFTRNYLKYIKLD